MNAPSFERDAPITRPLTYPLTTLPILWTPRHAGPIDLQGSRLSWASPLSPSYLNRSPKGGRDEQHPAQSC